MKHEMKLKEIYFDKIKLGEKIYEIRLNDEKRRAINTGDTIIFKKEPNLQEEITTEVQDLIYFDSFTKMLNELPLNEIGFLGYKKEDVEKIYHSIYSKSDEMKYGVVAIKLHLL